MQSAIFLVLSLMLATSYAMSDSSPMVMASNAIEEVASALQEHMPAGGSRAKRSTIVPVRMLSRTQFNQCQATAHETVCENGLQQRLHTLALECQMSNVADAIEFGCGQNSNGYYCSQGFEIVSLYSIELQACTSLQVCSSSCRSALSLINNDLGCCSGYFNSLLSGEQTALSAEFWQTCGLTPGPLCPIPTFDSAVSNTRACTEQEFSLMATQARCMPESLDQVINAQLENPGCESLGVVQAELCEFNGPDNFCVLMDTSSALSAVGACAQEISGRPGCSSTCSNALINMRNQLGCCINSVLNGTLARVFPNPNADAVLEFFSNDFWSRCNVGTPGFCESTVALNVTLVSGATKQAASVLSVALVMLVTAICAIL